MKNLIVVIAVLFFASCGNKTEPEVKRGKDWCSYQLGGKSGKDTFNVTDCKGLKQGIWITKKPIGTGYKAYKKVYKDTVIYGADENFETDTTYYINDIPKKKS